MKHKINKAKEHIVSRFRDFSPHGIALMLKASGAILSLGLFVLITVSIAPQGPVQSFDESILKWVETLRSPFMNAMMTDVTALGGLALTVVLGLLAVILFVLAKDPAAAFHLFLTASGGFYVSSWAKEIISRPRPSIIPQLIHASGFSYPSGHSITSSAIYLTMAILACRHFKSVSARILLLSLGGAMIALISFSRIYLGVHYPSDTLGGALIGIAWALFMGSFFAKAHFGLKKD